ncbi:MAG: ATP-dependent helicase [Candidatus Omnitrophica bacterium]|nr:ATP-dependent helicase [Candidatus Omnitrophota bacterium]
MEERVDLLLPYGYVDVALKTFHAFGDGLLREYALKSGRSSQFRVLSKAEQLVFLRQHLFELPLQELRPLTDPTRFLEVITSVFSRAKDEAVGPDEFLAYAQRLARADAAGAPGEATRTQASRIRELAQVYAAYEELLAQHDLVDFGDQVLLAIQLLERHPDILAAVKSQIRYVLVDEFQDTNYAQFRLLQLLAAPTDNVTVVADDDQSIYKWRGAAISNVVKFLEHYAQVQTVVLTENFRSPQPLLDCAYRLIRFNDPDRLECRQGIDKRLVARASARQDPPQFHVFDTASSEADWVARTIRQAIEAGARRAGDHAILVRSNREADLFLRALNVAGVPWQFSGASGLFAREESKLLLSCIKTLADPDDSLSWYHVASSPLYTCPMQDLTGVLAHAAKTHQSLRAVLEQLATDPAFLDTLSPAGRESLLALLGDVGRLLELARTHSSGQLLYRWLTDRGLLAALSRADELGDGARLQTIARFFHHLRRLEELAGSSLPEVVRHLELFQALGNEPFEDDDVWADRVSVLTLHKAKGLEFPVVFLVGLVQGRFPTPQRRELIELPEPLIKDILPMGDYHLQEERRLFYVGMTRAKDELHLTCAYDHGGKSMRKVSQFVLEALDLAAPSPPAKKATARELINRSALQAPLPVRETPTSKRVLRVDAHGIDDYRTCPLKYRYSHVLRIPVMRHHLVAYGAALHKAVELFFRRRLHAQPMTKEELLAVFDQSWNAEGFLTREHETLRRAQGRATLERFYAQQQEAPETPLLIEEKFRFLLDDLLVVGRWDRVDREGNDVVIIDYKSSEVRDQAAADRRAKESLQLLIYALAWRTLHGELPARVELRFLETGVTGRAVFDEDDLDRAKQVLQEAGQGIRARAFEATPQEFACHWCAFQTICPFAFQTR